MPFAAWAAVVSFVFAAIRAVQAWMALRQLERGSRLLQAFAWLLAAAGFAGFFSSAGDKIEVLKGAITMTPSTALWLVLLGTASVGLMALAGRSASGRGWGRTLVTHTALLAGCAVFGLPFAWLLVTSFKEDKDLITRDGKVVWVPKVSQLVPYNDAQNPLMEGTLDGKTVQGPIVARTADGKLQIDVVKPSSMRGMTLMASPSQVRAVPKMVPVVTGSFGGKRITGMVVEEMEGGSRRVRITRPPELVGVEYVALPKDVEAVRNVGLRVANYPESLEYLPPETNNGLVYLKNTLLLVVLSVIGTILSSALVAYGFSRLRFPGRNLLFTVLLSTMMLPAAVTLLPTFLIFRTLGWIDTLLPIWAPTFFAGAFNVFLLRQFFSTIPMELEDAAKIDGCSYLRTFWQVMLPQIKPALAVIAIWTFMGAWNNFMGPLIYISSPENMPLSYALQMFQSERGSEAGLMMAFATMSMAPVLLLFFFAQKYFIEGVTLSGMGGR